MPLYTVKKGRRYRARVNLGLFQQLASNKMVADKFREAGFTEVSVTGSGPQRLAKGLWPHDDASAEIPDEVDQIDVMEA